jgi:hypothetical protein
MIDIPESLIVAVKLFLGDEGIAQFREWKRKHGTVSPVISMYTKYGSPMPHPVHFREGMQIRNFMRGTGLCTGWDATDYDDNWKYVVEAAIE